MIDLKIALALAIAAFALAFGGGMKAGLWWNADDLAKCESTVASVKEISHALEIKNEETRLLSERASADAEKRFSAALAHARANPRLVRVREDCSGASGMPGLSPFAGIPQGLQTSEPGLSATRTITVAECEARINGSVMDAVWIETVKQLTDELHEASK